MADITLQHITKTFGGVKALEDVSLSFSPGEIHAVIGENGAGKSTVMKILGGLYLADDGESNPYVQAVRAYAAERNSEVSG